MSNKTEQLREQIVEGKMYRQIRKGQWVEVSQEDLTQEIVSLRAKLTEQGEGRNIAPFVDGVKPIEQ